MIEYKVVEVADVVEEKLEEALNHWTRRGWRLDGMHFVVKETARRPSMAFLLFVKRPGDGEEAA
ncbi:MAG: DUF4177 domain-containing protein [bacterium]